MSLDHAALMQQAITEAGRASLPFGAVIVDRRSGKVVAVGFNQSDINPTWHGEVVALNQWSTDHPDAEGREFALYTTAEPCPMCMAAIFWAGLELVVYGTSISTLQQLGWKQIDIRAEELIRRTPGWRCELISGVLHEQCDALFQNARGGI
jgi:tRNA(adenine34) deaminase